MHAQEVKKSAETSNKGKYFRNTYGVVDTVLSALYSYVTGNSFNAHTNPTKERLGLSLFYIR